MGVRESLAKAAEYLNNTASQLNKVAEDLNPPKAVKCPRCGSTEFIHAAKGYSKSKGVAGAMMFGRVGLIAGSSKNKITCVCKKCSKKWEV